MPAFPTTTGCCRTVGSLNAEFASAQLSNERAALVILAHLRRLALVFHARFAEAQEQQKRRRLPKKAMLRTNTGLVLSWSQANSQLKFERNTTEVPAPNQVFELQWNPGGTVVLRVQGRVVCADQGEYVTAYEETGAMRSLNDRTLLLIC